MVDQKEGRSTEVTCENCGRKAVHRRPGGRFCSQKCRVENWWKRKLGVSKHQAFSAFDKTSLSPRGRS